MSTLLKLTGYGAVLLTFVVIAGLLRWRRVRLSYFFPAYLLAVALGDAAALMWPARFYTWTFWVFREGAYVLLKLAIVVELSVVCFAAFPGARAVVRRGLLLALVFLVAAALIPTGAEDARRLAFALQPRIANGTAALFLGLWALILWYRIPVHALHLAILKGFVPYLLIFTFGMRLPADLSEPLEQIAQKLSGLPYVALLSYWAWAAWRREEVPDVPEVLLRRLQPWRFRA